MAQKAPGKHYRNGMTLAQLLKKFPDDATAEQWFVTNRWPNGVRCPRCDSDNIQERTTCKPQPYRCRSCRKDFSVKTGTLMQGSNLGFQTWALATYLFTTGIKGTSSMKLHRDLGITQKSAWHLAHRIRESWADQGTSFSGPVEVDETYVGGREKNKHGSKKIKGAKGTVGKAAVIGMKDRETKQVQATVIDRTDRPTLSGFVADHTAPGAKVYSDEHSGYDWVKNHEVVRHGIKEYVNGMAHTNGIESFWALLKRGYVGTYHKMSKKHLGRYVTEFSGRFNQRPLDTVEQMEQIARGLEKKRLRYSDLTAG